MLRCSKYVITRRRNAGSARSDDKDKAMTKTTDYTAMFKDVLGNFPVDTASVEGAFKTASTLNEKLSHVAIDAAEKSTEISSKWTKETLVKLGDMSKSKADPADYAKAMTDFASSYAEVTAEHMAAFAEVAKKVQTDTLELMMAAGKDMSEDASSVVKKATGDLTAAAKKAAAAK